MHKRRTARSAHWPRADTTAVETLNMTVMTALSPDAWSGASDRTAPGGGPFPWPFPFRRWHSYGDSPTSAEPPTAASTSSRNTPAGRRPPNKKGGAGEPAPDRQTPPTGKL